MPTCDDYHGSGSRTSKPALSTPPFAMRIVIYVLAALITVSAIWGIAASVRRVWVDAATSFSRAYYTPTDMLAAYGLDVSQPQQLVLGSDIVGSTGNIHVSTGFTLFAGSTTLNGSFQPGSAVRLGLTLGDKSYILEVPYQKVTFIQVPNAQPQAEISVDSVTLGSLKQRHYVGSFWRFSPTHPLAVPAPPQNEEWQKGPAGILLEHVTQVRLTVTPEQYRWYLGASQLPK